MSKLNFKKNEISGPIDNGSNFFNVNQVALLTDAFCRYLKDKFPKNLEKSIVLGINRRENDSEMFAKIVAKTFAKHEIKVFYSEITVIDSMISYAIRNLNILGGINITTDNNLLHYNGMKFYDESGFPMSSKKMIEIKSYCQEWNNFSEDNKSFAFEENSFVNTLPIDLLNKYIDEIIEVGGNIKNIKNVSVTWFLSSNEDIIPLQTISNKLNLNSFVDINTVNPNETLVEQSNLDNLFNNQETLDFVNKVQTDLIVSFHPGLNKIEYAVLHHGQYIKIDKEGIVLLLAYYLIEGTAKLNDENFIIIGSNSSTPILQKMANNAGISIIPIETTEENIINGILNNDNKNVLLYYDEDYNSLINTNVSKENDVLQSLITILKMINFYKNQKFSLVDIIEKIYTIHT